jgi:hydrogenase-1 operon protein HyaE
MARLVNESGATWVDETTVMDWSRQGGDRVLLLAGDPVQFPEGLDVAAVLPELMRSFVGRFQVGIVPRPSEAAVAKLYGSQRWPTLIFLRDGHYVTALAGMQDWDVYLKEVAVALSLPISRAPTIGIPVVASGTSANACH